MNIILIAGTGHAVVHPVWQALQSVGVLAAKPSRRERLLPTDIHQMMLQALAHQSVSADMADQPHPATSAAPLGKVWHELSSDLILGNIDQRLWGWTLDNNAALLRYWLDFDTQTRLVLPYATPVEYLLQQLPAQQAIAPEQVEQTLASWVSHTEAVLASFYAHGERTLLVHTQTTQRNPSHLSKALASQWAIHGLTKPQAASHNEPQPDYLQNLLLSMVMASPAAMALWQELEATAHVPAGLPAVLPHTEYQHWNHQAQLRELCQQANQTVAALQATHAQLEADKAQLIIERDLEAQAKAQAMQQLQAVQQALQDVTAAKDQLENQAQAIYQQSQDATNAIVALQAANAQLEADNAHLAHARDLQAQAKTHAMAVNDAQARESELLLLQLHQVQEELEHMFLEHQGCGAGLAQATQQLQAVQQALQDVTAAKDQTENQAQVLYQQAQDASNAMAALQAANAQLEADNAQLAQARDHEAQAKVQAMAVNDAQAQESELLLLQLHQVQEELEHYFLQHQSQLQPLQWVAAFWRRHPPEVINLDLCEPIDGSNWYHAETDGSWAGPGLVSTIQMPPLAAGTYVLELHIKDAMHPNFVLDMQVSAIADDTTATQTIELVHDFANHNEGALYPVVSAGEFTLAGFDAPWALNINLPSTVCPADTGGDDTRRLSIKLQAVRLVRQKQVAV